MRALGLARRSARQGGRPASVAGLCFLRGRDADGRLRELAAVRRAALPVLGVLAGAFVGRRLHEELGYRSLGDWSREKLGLGARAVRDWARVWERLQELPRLREAVCAGEVSFSVARLVVGRVTPQTEAACLADVRGRTLRAVQALVRAVREAEGRQGMDPEVAEAAEDDERVRVRLPCSRQEYGWWVAAVELARRVAGESLPVWACADGMAAETASTVGADVDATEVDADTTGAGVSSGVDARALGADAATGAPTGMGTPSGPRSPHSPVRSTPREGDLRDSPVRSTPQKGGLRDSPVRSTPREGAPESGLREQAWPRLRWRVIPAPLPDELAGLAEGLEECPALEVGRRFRAAIVFLQSLDFETGRILRQVLDRKLYLELDLRSFERYVRERLDLAPRTAQRLVALARTEHRAPAVATAFRDGRLTAFQAGSLVPVANLENARAWVTHAERVTLRRLEDEVETVPRPAIVFQAPPDVAAFFLAMVRQVGLERLLAHAIRTWVAHGQQFEDYADLERDGFRCTVPGCTARSGLQSHHIWFRSKRGPDVPWNRTTLCHFHHQRAVHGSHAGRVRIRGRAPDGLIYQLGGPEGERFDSGDVRLLGGRARGGELTATPSPS